MANVVPLILSATDIDNHQGKVALTVGYRGLPNEKGVLKVGDFLTFDVPNHGTFEIRLVKIFASYPAKFAEISLACLVFSETAATIERSLPSEDTLRADASNPFSAAEKAKLRQAMQEFRERVRETYHPTPEQDAIVTDELRNLSEMLDQLRRRVDWKGIVISTLVNDRNHSIAHT